MKNPGYTPEALAIRDQLAQVLAAAQSTEARDNAERELALHLLTEGLPLEDFTAGGRRFVVRPQVPRLTPLPGRERDAKKWLAGRSARSLAHHVMRKGGGEVPSDLFKPVQPRVNVHVT